MMSPKGRHIKKIFKAWLEDENWENPGVWHKLVRAMGDIQEARIKSFQARLLESFKAAERKKDD